MFAETPLQGGRQEDNFAAKYTAAIEYLRNPVSRIEELDFSPRTGESHGKAIGLGQIRDLRDYDRNFNGITRNGEFRGAYARARVVLGEP